MKTTETPLRMHDGTFVSARAMKFESLDTIRPTITKKLVQITPLFAEAPTKEQERELLRIRVLKKENSDFAETLASLEQDNIHLNLHRSISLDTQTRESFADVVTKNWKLPLTTAKGIVLETTEDTIPQGIKKDVIALRDTAKKMLTIQARDDVSLEQQKKIDRLNKVVWDDSSTKDYAIRRLTTDSLAATESDLKQISIVAGIAIAAATVLEVALPHLFPSASSDITRLLLAAGLVVTGQLDDGVGSLLNYSTQHPEEKNPLVRTFNMCKDNPLLLVGIGAAGVVDYKWLPDFLTNPDVPHKALAGLLFFGTAVTGSVITAAGNFHEFRKTIREHGKTGEIFGHQQNNDTNIVKNWLKLNGEALQENQSDKYRKGLLAGLGASLLLSTGFGALGFLAGKGIISTGIQGGIGPIETGGEVAGGNGGVERYNKYEERRKLRNRLR